MSSTLTKLDIDDGFDLLGVAPIERDIRQLRELMGPVRERSATSVGYRTIITNGTGKMTLGEREHAELERHAD